jgi:hypothetical protein
MNHTLWVMLLGITMAGLPLTIKETAGFELTASVQTTQDLVNSFARGYYECDAPGMTEAQFDKRMCVQETQAFMALTAQGCHLHITDRVMFSCPMITSEPPVPGVAPVMRSYTATVLPPPPPAPKAPLVPATPLLPDAPPAAHPSTPRAIIPMEPPAANPTPPPLPTVKPPVVIPWRQRVEQRQRQLVACKNAVLAEEMKVPGACDYKCSQAFEAANRHCDEMYQ